MASKSVTFLEFEHAWDHFDQAQTQVINGPKDGTALKTQADILIRTPSQIEIRVFKNTRQPEGKLGIRLKAKSRCKPNALQLGIQLKSLDSLLFSE